MNAYDKFITVQNALKSKAEELKVEGKLKDVNIAETGRPPVFPRAIVWVRRGTSQDIKIAGMEKYHVWRFEYVIETRDALLKNAYESAMEIMWSLYEKIIADRGLGITTFSVEATPCTEFQRLDLRDANGLFGQIIIMTVDVKVWA